MSKFPNAALALGCIAGFAGIAAVSITFAERSIVQVPENNPTVPFVVKAAAETEPVVEPVTVSTSGSSEQADAAPASATAEPEAVQMAQAETNASKAEERPVKVATQGTDATSGTFGIGRTALPEEIAAWDVDVMPDGTGLPEGSGDVWTGEEVFAEQCAACHGDFAEGRGNWPKLAGGWDTLDRNDPVKTVGSYWPYLSTVWDYIHRSMPFGAAQTLTDDEVYAITAYILYSNDIVGEDFTLSHENFLEVEMPNADGFIVDNRAEVEYPQWRAEPCMENCKNSVEITMRASVLDVTPDEGADEAEMEADAEEVNAEGEATEVVVLDDAATEEAPSAAPDPELVAAGEQVFKKCKSCHQLGEGAKNRTGPMLNGIVGHPAGAIEGFRYSKALKEAGENGLIWTEEELKAFLAKPRDYLKGTKMSFPGLRKDADQEAIVEYLKTFPAE